MSDNSFRTNAAVAAPAGDPDATSIPVIAVIGNPNTGKSTLFNELTGLRQKIGNYPGVTVERHEGRLKFREGQARLIDLPGTYALTAQSPDEMVTVDVLLGYAGEPAPSAVLVIVDAANLRRNLFLASQVLDLGLPTVIALNMMDHAGSKGITIDVPLLADMLGVPVIPMVATRKEGLEPLKVALSEAVRKGGSSREKIDASAERLDAIQGILAECEQRGLTVHPYHVERALIDEGGFAELRLLESTGEWGVRKLKEKREILSAESTLAAQETRRRYTWINRVVSAVEQRRPVPVPWSQRIDRVVSHPFLGTLIFLIVMAAMFQSVFAWAQPLMNGMEAATALISAAVGAALPPGAVASLISEGIIAGVGSVLVFLPQIMLLSLFVILLEDTGYMARAAFLMDRLMRFCGLSGQSFIPMLSSFACAVPGIMATRVIPDTRDRLATILAAPFMTCSARLPIYALLISAFVPPVSFLHGWLNLQGLVLLGLYLLGILGGITTALLVKRAVLRGPTPVLLLELPPYRLPSLKSVVYKLAERFKSFIVRAGSIIFTVSVVIWALAYFPHPQQVHDKFEAARATASTTYKDDALKTQLTELDHQESAAFLDQSLLGRMGRAVEPVFRPLGWDWKVSAAVIASFPAREVVIAVLGTIYAVGADVDEKSAGLVNRLRIATWPDGAKVFSLATAVGLMVFYAFCLQCGATVAIIRRETNSWKWAGFAWVYMTSLGYAAAFASVRLLTHAQGVWQ